MAKFRRDGTFYIKSLGGVDLASNGARKGLFCKAIPPYVVVERAWIHFWALGTNGVPMNAKQEIQISGRMANMDLDIDANADQSTHDTLEELMARYMPTGLGQEQFDDDQADASGAGLAAGGSGPMSKWAREREFYSYQAFMGLGKNAMMTESNTIRYVCEGSTGSTGINISGRGCNIDQFRLIGIDASTEVFANDINQAVETHVWGNVTADPSELAQQAFYAFGHQGAAPATQWPGNITNTFEDTVSSPDGTQMGIDETGASAVNPFATDSMLYRWLNTGYGEDAQLEMDATDDSGGSGFDDGTVMNVQTAVTLKCKTIKPIARNIFTPY